MKKSTIKLLLLEFLIIFSFLLNIFVANITSQYIITSYILMCVLVTILLVGYEKTRNRLKKDAILNIVTMTVAFQIVIYLSGFFLGFLKNGYSMKLDIILRNIIPIILIIISSEILRYSINQKGRESKIVLIISAILFCLLDCMISGMNYDLSNRQKIVEFICMVVFPSISKNIFLTYNTTKFGYQSSIIYRFIIELPRYVIPIVPNISKYLESVIYLLLPVIVMIVNIKTLNTDNTFNDEKESTMVSKISLIIFIIVLLLIISLNSGLFKYFAITVGSGSMEKELYVGDIAISEKVKEKDVNKLKVGNIIVYKFKNKIIVHRIYKIENKNNEISIITKGDNNKEPDNWIVKESYIIGKVKFKIKYLGYPTVWLNESFAGGKK